MKSATVKLDENTPVADYPAVRQAKASHDTKLEQHQTVLVRVEALDRLCAPFTSSSGNHEDPPDRLAVLQAQARLPGLRLQLWEREAELEKAQQAHREAMADAVKCLEAARLAPRRELVQQLFGVMDQAKKLAEEIERFDHQTAALGGRPQPHPFGELLDTPHRPSMVSFRREYFAREGAL